MPRTVEEILAKADELAKKFETFEPGAEGPRDGAPLRAVREAFEDVAMAQRRLAERVAVAKATGHSWSSIGAMMGTTGEAARQRFSQIAKRAQSARVAYSAKTDRARKPAAASGRTRKSAAKTSTIGPSGGSGGNAGRERDASRGS